MMRALFGKPQEVRAHALMLSHKLQVRDGVFVTLRSINLVGSLSEGNRVRVEYEWGRGRGSEEFAWTEKVQVK